MKNYIIANLRKRKNKNLPFLVPIPWSKFLPIKITYKSHLYHGLDHKNYGKMV